MKLKKILKPYFIIPLTILFLVVFMFVGWRFAPKKQMNVVVIDKTVPATDADRHSYEGDVSNDYRKHIGFYWLLEQQKIVNTDSKYYDYKSDYIGPILDANRDVDYYNGYDQSNTSPDLVYLTDTYGVESESDSESKGVSQGDIGYLSLSHSNGATIIAEMETMSNGTEASVAMELQQTFGITESGWVGRYIFELQDLTDVPWWAPSLYTQTYGTEWNFSGPGILLVSGKGNIIVLEEKTDFESKNLLKIKINDDYKSEFGNYSTNFYNWFEIINANYETEVIASYKFNLNAAGTEKFAEVSDTTTFAAVTRITDESTAPAYYFAGDFNDYVTKSKFNKFLFANKFFAVISVDREGDVTNFFWHFYMPLMKNIFDSVEYQIANKNYKNIDTAPTTEIFKIENNSFQLLANDEWQDFDIKGFNINAIMPGETSYSRDYANYKQLIQAVVDVGGNCIRAYDLMPPEFYRALYQSNKENPKNTIYFIQTIIPPDDILSSDYLLPENLADIDQIVQYTIDAIHGEGLVPSVGSRQEATYYHDVSEYLIGYIVDMNISSTDLDNLYAADSEYSYSGTYFSADTNPAEALIACVCDFAYTYQLNTFKYRVPIGAVGSSALLTGAPWNGTLAKTYDVSKIKAADETNSCFFVSYSLQPSDSALLDNQAAFSSFTDSTGAYPYGGYLEKIKELQNRYPVLVDGFGLSTNTNSYDKDKTVNGLTEEQQGKGIIRMLSAIRSQNYLGGFISDLNDSWTNVSDAYAAFTVPLQNESLWHNILDPAETTGILSVESNNSSEIGIELNDTGRMRQVQLSANETYLTMTILLSEEVNYDLEQLIIGLDTYQRNNGEYYYDSNYFANSLSGMEFVIKFESKISAGLYVTPSYNINNNAFTSKESYAGLYNFVTQLVYGNFDSSSTNFYQSGSTINIRIPWALLNVTDPSQRLVVNDESTQVSPGGQIKTVSTDGLIFSLLIADKTNQDTKYIFPETKQSTGYKRYSWNMWETVDYSIKRKGSFNFLKSYFTQ